MNNINFTGRNNFPLSVETMTFLQEMIGMTGTLALLGGDTYILSGCETTELNVSSGYVVIDGEILTFTGGALQEYVYIKEEKRTVTAQGYTFQDVYNERSVEFGYGEPRYKWENFKRVSTNTELADAIANINTTIKGLSGLPIGVPVDFAGKTDKIPADFMLCDGRLLNSEEYPELFDVIGHLHGGSGTSFALPLAGGRVSVGYDENDPDYNQIGKKGGAKELIQTPEQMPNHYHAYTDDSYANGSFPEVESGFPNAYNDVTKQTSGEKKGTGRVYKTSKAGNSEPMDIRQPYIVMPKIIRVR